MRYKTTMTFEDENGVIVTDVYETEASSDDSAWDIAADHTSYFGPVIEPALWARRAMSQ